MKLLLKFTVLTFLLIVNIANASASPWVNIGNIKEINLYIDDSRIYVSHSKSDMGPHLDVWLKTQFTDYGRQRYVQIYGKQYTAAKEKVLHVEFDTELNRFKIDEYYVYDKDGKIIIQEFEPYVNTLVPGSEAEWWYISSRDYLTEQLQNGRNVFRGHLR